MKKQSSPSRFTQFFSVILAIVLVMSLILSLMSTISPYVFWGVALIAFLYLTGKKKHWF